jgi:hypothetical protein
MNINYKVSEVKSAEGNILTEKDEVSEQFTISNNEELCFLCTSLSIISTEK